MTFRGGEKTIYPCHDCTRFTHFTKARYNSEIFFTDIPVVEDDWKPEEVAAVGQLLLDVAQQLTKE